MSLHFEMIRLHGLEISKELRKERMREAELWRLCSTSINPTWLARQGCRLLRRLGSRLVRVGQHLQALSESPDPLHA